MAADQAGWQRFGHRVRSALRGSTRSRTGSGAGRPRAGRGALASWRGVPRLRADRRDLVRDAQRPPRPGAGRPYAGGPGRGVLPAGHMTTPLLDLPSYQRQKLVTALRTKALTPPYPDVAVISAIGAG